MEQQHRKDNTDRLKRHLFDSGEMERILDYSYDGIWITDGQGRVLYVNSTNERMLGIQREDVLGRTSAELVKGKLFESSAPLQVIKTKRAVTTMGYNYKTKKNVLITGNPIFGEDGEIKYIISNVRDVSQINKMMDQIKQKDELIDQQRREIQRLLSVQREDEQKGDVVAHSESMLQVLEMARRVARFDSTVLVLGESGVGKEVVVRRIVQRSDRAVKPFIKVNCTAIPPDLLESELFGYEKGAFTGANPKGKMGMFELANTGTIFLDEVGELELSLQVKLLRALQEREIVRVGGTKPVNLDIRIITATNRNLEEMVREGTFRKDLYYRLNVISIHIPPLRERPDDIPHLIRYFLQQFSEKHGVNRSITIQSMQALADYPWPGNIRELQNVMENLVVMASTDTIDLEDIQNRLHRHGSGNGTDTIPPLRETLRQVESDLIARAMQQCKTTRAAAAVLGVDQSTIVRKLKALGLDAGRE